MSLPNHIAEQIAAIPRTTDTRNLAEYCPHCGLTWRACSDAMTEQQETQ